MNILVYGVGKFAEYVEYAVTNDSNNVVCGFCVESKYRTKNELNGLSIVDFDNIEIDFPPDKYQLFIAIGLNKERQRIFDLAKAKGYKMISYVSSKSFTWKDLKYGENTWIGEATRIQPFVSIGDNSILFGPGIGHHSVIGDHTLLTGSVLGGNVCVGDFSFLGINSSVKHNVDIGRNNIIGMGCNIEKSTGDGEIYHTGKSTKVRTLKAEDFEMKCLR